MLALGEYEAGVHEVCGMHDSIATTDPPFTLEDRYCPMCDAITRHLRERAHREHELTSKQKNPAARQPADGRRGPFVRLLRPEEAAKLVSRGGSS